MERKTSVLKYRIEVAIEPDKSLSEVSDIAISLNLNGSERALPKKKEKTRCEYDRTASVGKNGYIIIDK